MAGYHSYLLASLPMLHFGAKPPLSFEGFCGACRGLVSDEEYGLLEALPRGEVPGAGAGSSLLKAWASFERALNNELAKARAGRQHKDPAKHVRGDADAEPAITHLAVNVTRQPDILEAERMLDAARWEQLEAWGLGHYLDTEALLLYGLKLLILERWQRIGQADTKKSLKELDL